MKKDREQRKGNRRGVERIGWEADYNGKWNFQSVTLKPAMKAGRK